MITIKDKQLKYEKALEYEIFTKGEYVFGKEKIIKAKNIFDIGGHIGLFSKRCRSLNSTATIHYFEPVGEFYNKAKTSLNNDKNIIFNNYGISYETNTGIILVNEEKTMQSSKYKSFLNTKGKEIKVSFIKMKDYLIENHINEIDVLKMDIEGMELEVLSSRGDFERKMIKNMILEIHLLNEEMKIQYKGILQEIKNNLGNVQIINQGYCKEIFLIWAFKEPGL